MTPSGDADRKPLWRGWIHLVGAPTLVAASTVLYLRAPSWAALSWVLCFVVGVTSMMTTSALYNRFHWSPVVRRRWKRADHSTIFLAISGSYFAIAGLTMHGDARIVLLLVVGLGTATGITIRQLALDTPKWVNILPYVVVGWAALAFLPQIYRGGGAHCFWLVVAGGVFYSVGATFYATKRPRLRPKIFGYHELFHACTIGGAACHFAALYVALR